MKSIDVIAKTLKLEDDSDDTVLMKEFEVFDAIQAIGYEGPKFKKKKKILKAILSK